MAITRTVEM